MKLTPQISQGESVLKSNGNNTTSKGSGGFDKLMGLVTRKSEEKPLALVQRGKLVTFKGVPFVDEHGNPIQLQSVHKGKNQRIQIKTKPISHNSTTSNLVPPYEIWREHRLSEPGKANLVHHNFKFLANEHLKATRKLRHGILTGKVKTPGQNGEKTDALHSGDKTNDNSAIAHLITSARELTRRQIVREGGKFSNKLNEVSQEEIDASLDQVRKTLNLQSDPRVRPFAPPNVDNSGSEISRTKQNFSKPASASQKDIRQEVRGKGIDPGMILGDNRATRYGSSKPAQLTPFSANDSKLITPSMSEKTEKATKNSGKTENIKHDETLTESGNKSINVNKSDSTHSSRVLAGEKHTGNHHPGRNGKSGDGEFPINPELLRKNKHSEDQVKKETIPDIDPKASSSKIRPSSNIADPIAEKRSSLENQPIGGDHASFTKVSEKKTSFERIEYESVSEERANTSQAKVVKAKVEEESSDSKSTQHSSRKVNSGSAKGSEQAATAKTESNTSSIPANDPPVKPQSANAKVESLKKRGWRIHTPITSSKDLETDERVQVSKKAKAKNVNGKKDSSTSTVKLSNSQSNSSINEESTEVLTDDTTEKVLSSKELKGFSQQTSNSPQTTNVTHSNKTASHQAQQMESRFADIENLKEVLQKIEGRAKIVSNGGTTTMQIRLAPKSLGLMHVKIFQSDGRYEVSLRTNSPEAAKALESQVDQIKTELSNSGIQVDKLNVSTDGSKSNDRQATNSFSQEQSKQNTGASGATTEFTEEPQLNSPISLDLGTNSVDFIG
ncbi:flagellar hook-length control protein FliK [bacterium]|nr:flagellar hook-length control protein FliK [bacterium]